MSLLTTNNPKVLKGNSLNYHTAILHLSPHESAGIQTKSGEILNICPNARNCPDICLNYSGHGGMGDPILNKVQKARRRRTRMWFFEREEFFKQLKIELIKEGRYASKRDLGFAFRPNGTSDLPSLGKWAATTFPDLQIYDYTKIPEPWKRTRDNYHLTFSFDGDNWEECERALQRDINVAVVFNGKDLPETFRNYPVISGEESDCRFKDPTGRIIGLVAKGPAKKDAGVFTIKHAA